MHARLKSPIIDAETIISGTWSTNVRLEEGCYGFTNLVVSHMDFLFYRSIIQAHCIFFSLSNIYSGWFVVTVRHNRITKRIQKVHNKWSITPPHPDFCSRPSFPFRGIFPTKMVSSQHGERTCSFCQILHRWSLGRCVQDVSVGSQSFLQLRKGVRGPEI